MAKALECPACGARHPLDSLPDARTFRCDRCGQSLKVPDAIDPPPASPRRTATSRATSPVPAAATSAPLPPPRRGGSAATGPRVSATATVAAASATSAMSAGPVGSPDDPVMSRNGAPPTPRRRVHWYWRILAWITAVPLGLVITGWPALQLHLMSKDDLLDVFVGEGTGRYFRLLVFAAAWALVTALLVQLFVEGGRWWSTRRRARAGNRTPLPV